MDVCAIIEKKKEKMRKLTLPVTFAGVDKAFFHFFIAAEASFHFLKAASRSEANIRSLENCKDEMVACGGRQGLFSFIHCHFRRRHSRKRMMMKKIMIRLKKRGSQSAAVQHFGRSEVPKSLKLHQSVERHSYNQAVVFCMKKIIIIITSLECASKEPSFLAQ